MTDEELVLIPTKDLNKVVKESGWIFKESLQIDHLNGDDDADDDDADDDDDDNDDNADDDAAHRFDKGRREEAQREATNSEEQVKPTNQIGDWCL